MIRHVPCAAARLLNVNETMSMCVLAAWLVVSNQRDSSSPYCENKKKKARYSSPSMMKRHDTKRERRVGKETRTDKTKQEKRREFEEEMSCSSEDSAATATAAVLHRTKNHCSCVCFPFASVRCVAHGKQMK